MTLPALAVGQKWQCRDPDRYCYIERERAGTTSKFGAVLRIGTNEPVGTCWYYTANRLEDNVYRVFNDRFSPDDLIFLLAANVEAPTGLYPELRVGQVWAGRKQTQRAKVLRLMDGRAEVECSVLPHGHVEKRSVLRTPYPSGYAFHEDGWEDSDLVQLLYDPTGAT